MGQSLPAAPDRPAYPQTGRGGRSVWWRLPLRSAGVRFAFIYALLFGLSSCLLAVSLWYTTTALLQRQVEGAIRTDVISLQGAAQNGGLPALAAAINLRLGDAAQSGGIYLLLDGQNTRLTGNLDLWPAGLSQMDAWYQLPVSRNGEGSLALLRAEALPNGARLLVGRDVQGRAELRAVLLNALIWAGCLMILLGLLGALLIRSIFSRMMHDIAATSRAIARGDLSHRLKHGGGDEFDELAIVINSMLDRISQLMDGVRQVSNAIAHDLRTPVTRARTRLEDALLYAHTVEDMHAAIERATQDLDGIVGVFEALLRIAEIEAGSRRAAFAPIDLETTLLDMDELYRVVAEERGLLLRTDIASPLPVLGDRELMQQAVANLLDNALKFARPGTLIRFSARVENHMVEISIADRGPGIAEPDRTRATERFFRAETARSTMGSGLGLALVSAVAQLHNGTLQLSDNHPGLRAVILIPARG